VSGNGTQRGSAAPRARRVESQVFRGFLWAALGGTALGISLDAERKGWKLDRIETRLTCNPGEGKINSIELELLLAGDFSDKQRGRLAEIASRCPVHRTLSKGVTITHH